MSDYDQLFAIRISLQDIYNDEFDIIKNLKIHLINSGESDIVCIL